MTAERDLPARFPHLLQALWGLSVSVQALPASARRARFEAGRIALPSAGSATQLAAVAHAGAHLFFVDPWVPALRSGVKDAAPRPGHEINALVPGPDHGWHPGVR